MKRSCQNSAALAVFLGLCTFPSVQILAAEPSDTSKTYDEEQRDFAQRVSRHTEITRYVIALRKSLDNAWESPPHRGILVTQRKVVLNASGKVIKRELIADSKSPEEDAAIDKLLDTFKFAALPSSTKQLELQIRFMALSSRNMVQITTAEKWPTLNSSVHPPQDLSSSKVQSKPINIDDAYAADLQRRTKRAWFPASRSQSHTVVVVFTIDKGGDVSNIRITQSSGIAVVDKAATKAIENAAPYRPLPQGYPASVDYQFTFDQGTYSSGRPGFEASCVKRL